MAFVLSHRKKILAGLVFSFLCFFSTRTPAATPDDFKTPEYWNSTGLEIINAASAYAQGYTGQGIALGIMDTPVLVSHPELAGKVLAVLLPAGYPLGDWSRDSHGTHVAGIMVAASNGVGMEGVAFDADLYSVGLDLREGVQQLAMPDFLSFFSALPNVKIINNSWGNSSFPYEVNDNVQRMRSMLQGDTEYTYLSQLVLNYDKLMVFAAGNAGHQSPQLEGILPRYNPALTGWINVVSIDPAAITIDANGQLTGDVQTASIFSNLATGAQLFTVAAPGSNINSLDAISGTGYRLMSGTSMAAPYVSGALGLVQQAFPWMTSKQLADAVLTTADNSTNQRFIPPTYTITMEETQTSPTLTTERIIVYYINKPVSTNVQADLEGYYAKNSVALKKYYSINSLEDFLSVYAGTYATMNEAGATVVTSTAGLAQTVAFEDVFGQGILNVGLAVRGPAILDANRLASTDYSATYHCALYGVNTQGYTGVWSNDISERQWINSLHHQFFQYNTGDDPTDPDKADAVALINQHVGLLKDGAGTLVLTGYDTYSGATVVRDGTLSITRQAGVTNSGTLTNSSVTVESAGTLTGNGTIANTVTNSGLVIPGNSLGDSLTVGSYVQQGTASDLFLRVTAAGAHTTLQAGQLAFHGGAITLAAPQQTYYANQSVSFAFSSLFGGTLTSTVGFDWDTDVAAGSYNTTSGAMSTTWVSPTLQALVNVARDSGGTPESLTLTFTRPALAYSRYAVSANARSVGTVFDRAAGCAVGDAQNLVTALDFSGVGGGDVSTALEQLGPRQFAAATKASMLAQHNISNALLEHLLPSAAITAARPSGVASGDPAQPVWNAFVSPLGGLGYTGSQDGQASSSTSWAGMLAGISTDRTTDRGEWTLGGHGSYIHMEQHSGGPGTNRTTTDGVSLGGQFRFKPQALATPHSGGYVFGLARAGVESADQYRTVAVNGYFRTAKSNWLSPMGSLLAGTGWDFTPPSLDRLTFGPLGWLEYSTAWRPPVSESGGLAANLKLQDSWSNSLRSSLGGHVSLNLPTGEVPAGLLLEASAVWNHSLLDEYGSIRARFADFSGNFTYHDTVADRDTATLTASVTASLPHNLSIGLNAGTELGANHTDGWGGLKFGWTF